MSVKRIASLLALVMSLLTVFACLPGCTGQKDDKTFTVGICNYVDDASLNQIVDNIEARLGEIAEARGVTIKIDYDNCNADSTLLNQIIANFIADDVDLMIGIATPVAMAMQAATEDSDIPVVFAAVSTPVESGLVESMEKPGVNMTGTSDFLNTTALLDLVLASKPGTDLVALLYDIGQDSSTAAIASAKQYLTDKGIAYREYNGRTVDEVSLAVDSLISDGVDAVFTPTDNTIMKAELAIYEKLAAAKIGHFAGADSFALNGAFVGYGVDYANLGRETAEMVAELLLDGKKASEMPVKTFDNGTATVNTEIAADLGYDFDALKAAFAPYCTKVESITTAEDFAK